jgi:hypothetical protein
MDSYVGSFADLENNCGVCEDCVEEPAFDSDYDYAAHVAEQDYDHAKEEGLL